MPEKSDLMRYNMCHVVPTGNSGMLRIKLPNICINSFINKSIYFPSIQV